MSSVAKTSATSWSRSCAPPTVAGELLGTPHETMRSQLGDGEPKLFTPWMAAHDLPDEDSDDDEGRVGGEQAQSRRSAELL